MDPFIHGAASGHHGVPRVRSQVKRPLPAAATLRGTEGAPSVDIYKACVAWRQRGVAERSPWQASAARCDGSRGSLAPPRRQAAAGRTRGSATIHHF